MRMPLLDGREAPLAADLEGLILPPETQLTVEVEVDQDLSTTWYEQRGTDSVGVFHLNGRVASLPDSVGVPSSIEGVPVSFFTQPGKYAQIDFRGSPWIEACMDNRTNAPKSTKPLKTGDGFFRDYSVAGHGDTLELFIANVLEGGTGPEGYGVGTRGLFEAHPDLQLQIREARVVGASHPAYRPGTITVDVSHGKFAPTDDGKPLILYSTFTGVAPFKHVVDDALGVSYHVVNGSQPRHMETTYGAPPRPDKKIMLVHAVKHPDELGPYHAHFMELQDRYPDNFAYVAYLSREPTGSVPEGVVLGRLQNAWFPIDGIVGRGEVNSAQRIADGEHQRMPSFLAFQERFGMDPYQTDPHVMYCGNTTILKDARAVFGSKNGGLGLRFSQEAW